MNAQRPLSDTCHFDLSAKIFVPSKKQFDPFEVNEANDDPEMDELSHHYLNSNLLDDEPPMTTTTATTIPTTTKGGNNLFMWQQDDWKSAQKVEDIWKQDKLSSSVWDSFEPYSRGNEQEFDPTLHFYHGALYDASTIEDMNLLKDNCPSAEETQVENVGEDMTTLQMLQTIFSDLSEQKLIDTLEKNDYDVDRTIEALLSNTTNVKPSNNDTKKRQVCRHFLAGECYRKDCWFVHDLQEKVCKFWLQGGCLKGELCEFSHNIDIQEAVANKINSSKQSQVKNDRTNVLNPNDYPALGTSAKQTSVKSQSANVVAEEEFPSLAAANKIKKSAPPQSVTKTINFAEIAKKKANTPAGTVKRKQATPHPYQKLSLQKLKQPVRIPWLETGSSLNSIYMKEREKAIEYGTLRNRLFAKATEYYLKGDGARARLYSMEAKHYNKLMQEMHTEASRRIFEQRSKHEAFIDLHGLHQDEAIDIIEEQLQTMRQNNYTGIVYIVTGTGHHSGASGLSKKMSKLKPYVEEYLRQENYRFAETNMVGDTKGGIFAVDLSSKK